MSQSTDDAPPRATLTERPGGGSGPHQAMRVPPHNLAAEESLLGAMLLSKDAIATAVELVDADDFYKPAHGHIFEAVASLFSAGEPVDPITVAEELNRAGLLEGVGGPATLVSLQASTPATSNAARYAKIVEEDYAAAIDAEGKRLLDRIAGGAIRMGELIDDLLDFSRIGRADLKKSLMDMNSLVRDALGEIPEAAVARDHLVVEAAHGRVARADWHDVQARADGLRGALRLPRGGDVEAVVGERHHLARVAVQAAAGGHLASHDEEPVADERKRGHARRGGLGGREGGEGQGGQRQGADQGAAVGHGRSSRGLGGKSGTSARQFAACLKSACANVAAHCEFFTISR